MTHGLILALSLLAANQPMPPMTPAPPGTPETRYCLRVDPLIGSRIETIQCKTRDEWATLGLDVDQEWAENGVKVIGPVTG
jgi:hypothetical protein